MLLEERYRQNCQAVFGPTGINGLTLLLLLDQLLICPIQNHAKNPEKFTEKWQMGTHLIVRSESHSMNTNMTEFILYSKIFAYLDESSLSIGRVKACLVGGCAETRM